MAATFALALAESVGMTHAPSGSISPAAAVHGQAPLERHSLCRLAGLTRGRWLCRRGTSQVEVVADGSNAPHKHSWKLLRALQSMLQMCQQTSMGHSDRGASHEVNGGMGCCVYVTVGTAYALKRKNTGWG